MKPGQINIKVKNVQSIRKGTSAREDVFIEHIKRTHDEWDVWMATETWRQDEAERFDIEGESEEEGAKDKEIA